MTSHGVTIGVDLSCGLMKQFEEGGRVGGRAVQIDGSCRNGGRGEVVVVMVVVVVLGLGRRRAQSEDAATVAETLLEGQHGKRRGLGGTGEVGRAGEGYWQGIRGG